MVITLPHNPSPSCLMALQPLWINTISGSSQHVDAHISGSIRSKPLRQLEQSCQHPKYLGLLLLQEKVSTMKCSKQANHGVRKLKWLQELGGSHMLNVLTFCISLQVT